MKRAPGTRAAAAAASAGVRVDYRESEAARFDWSAAQYDLVVAIFVQFASPALRAAMFDGMTSALAPGGLIILEGYGLKQLEYRTGGPKDAEHLYTPELVRESFAPLEILHLVERDDVLDEGAAHRGMSALVNLVARRRDEADRRNVVIQRTVRGALYVEMLGDLMASKAKELAD